MSDEEDFRSNRVWFYLTLVLGFLMAVTGITGIVDGFVEWKESFQPMVDFYKGVRSWCVSLLPFHVPKIVFDWIVLANAVWLSLSMAQRHLARYTDLFKIQRFHFLLEALLYLVFLFIWPLAILWAALGPFVLRPWSKNETRAAKSFFRTLSGIFATAIVILFFVVDYQALST